MEKLKKLPGFLNNDTDNYSNNRCQFWPTLDAIIHLHSKRNAIFKPRPAISTPTSTFYTVIDHDGQLPMPPIPSVRAMELLPNHCGWLCKKRKQEGGLKCKLPPQRRWCCIKKGIFYYYKKDFSKKEQGSFYLYDCTAETVEDKYNTTGLWFRIVKPDRSYDFQAETLDAQQTWIKQLSKAAVLKPPPGCSSFHEAIVPPEIPKRPSPFSDVRRGLPSHVPEIDKKSEQLTTPEQSIEDADTNKNPIYEDYLPIDKMHDKDDDDDDDDDDDRSDYDDVETFTQSNPSYDIKLPIHTKTDGDSDNDSNDNDSNDSVYDDILVENQHSLSDRRRNVDQVYNNPVDEGFISRSSEKSNSSRESNSQLQLGHIPEIMTNKENSTESRNKLQPSIEWQPNPCFYQKLYFALYDFQAKYADELTFQKGDLIKIVDKTFGNHQWWVGHKEGKPGLIPKKYLQPVYLKKTSGLL